MKKYDAGCKYSPHRYDAGCKYSPHPSHAGCNYRLGPRLDAIAFGVFVLLVVAVPSFAHHGNAAYEDKRVMLKGTVTAWIWTNPHVFLKMDVKDDQGNITHWTGELVAPSNIINFGFRPDSFKPGDEVTMVTTNVAKNGAPVARLSAIILADGKVMKTNSQDDGNAAAFKDHAANAQK